MIEIQAPMIPNRGINNIFAATANNAAIIAEYKKYLVFFTIVKEMPI